jgi:hypothetical protein
MQFDAHSAYNLACKACAEVDCGSRDLGFPSSDDSLSLKRLACYALLERESDQSPDAQQLAEPCSDSENNPLIIIQW